MDEFFAPQGPFWMSALRRLRVALALAAGLLASLALLGTFLGIRTLATLDRDLVPMAPQGAVLVLLLLGALLLTEVRPDSAAARRVACGLAVLVALPSLLLALGHARGGTPALEGWMLGRWPGLQVTSLLTDLALLGAAAAFLLRWSRPDASWSKRQVAALVAMVPETIGALVLISYAAGAPLLYGTRLVPMSLPSALCAWTLAFALHLGAGMDTWPLAAFRQGPGRGRAGSVLRVSSAVWTLFLSLGALVLVSGAFYLRGQLQLAQGRAEGELGTIASAKVRQIGSWMDERRSDAEQVVHGGLLQTQLSRFLEGSPSAPPEGEVRAWMTSLQKGTYRQVVLFDGQGRVRLAVPEEAGPTRGLEASEVQAALASREVLVQDLHRHPGQSEIHLGLWAPIGLRAGARAQGVLLLVLDPRQFLFPLVQSWPTPSPSAETLLVRREGDSVLFLNDLRHRAGTALTLRQPLASTGHLPATQAVLGREGLVTGVDYRGVPVLSVLSRVPGTPWFMVAKVDTAEIYGPLRQRVWVGTLALVAALSLVAGALGVLLRHLEAERSQKQLNLLQHFELLMREANDIILLIDGEGRIQDANTRALESYGYTLEELQAMNVLDLRSPEERAAGQALFSQVKASGSGRFEAVHRRKDGSTFPVEVSSRAMPLDGELRLITFGRDISERRAQERELQRMTRLYSALSQVNQAIVWSPTREALFDRICEVMVELGHCGLAWIAWNDPVTHRVEVAARHGDTQGVLDGNVVRSDDSPEGRGAVGTAIRQGRPCLIHDYLATPESAPWREKLAAAGLVSIAAFPIFEGGEVCGALAVYAADRDFFGKQEAALLEEAAMDISFALDHLAGEARRLQAEIELKESERFLRDAEEAGGIGTYVWDIAKDVWKSSAYLDRILGIDQTHPRDLQGWLDLVAPSFREQFQAYVTGIIARQERFDLRYPILRKADGTTRWVRGTGELQWDADGRPLSLTGAIRDITEQRQAEAALRASEEKFSKAFQASPDSVNINRLSDGVYVAVNDGFTRVSGYAAEEVLGRSSLPGDLGLWVHAEDRLRLQEGLSRDGMVEGLEAPFRRKDGSVLTGLMSASLIEIEGEPCVLSIVRDITQLRAQARQLEGLTQMYAALSQVNQAIVFSPTREALLDKICDVMVTFGRFSMAWIGWNDPATHEVRVASAYGDTHGYLEGLEVRSDDTPMGRGPTGRAIREGVSCVENDFLGSSAASPWHARAIRCGYASTAAFPIRQGDLVCGSLCVYSTEKGFFGTHEVALLEEAAGDISFALEHLAGEARRKEMEESLHTLSAALDQSPFSVMITDAAGAIEYVNPWFTTVTGYGAAEVLGRNPRLLKSPATPPKVHQQLWQTLSRGEIWTGELENLRKGGEPYHERASIAPVKDAEGRLIHYIAIKEDVTGLKRDQEERRSLEAQLHQAQKLESLGSLAGGVAHDMNNVLGAILSLSSAMRESADPFSPVAKNLDTITNACLRGRGVVKSLLYFAQKDLQEERLVDLNDLVRELSQLLSHLTLQRVQLDLDLQEGLGLVRGDAGALSHALMNLCVNAIDAMPKGGSLRIQTAAQEGGLLLRVEDTGTGMAPEVLAKAMEPFFTTKPQGKGTGLGLAMVYGTMKAHEGAFELRSQPGQGTEAVLRFPPGRVEPCAPAPGLPQVVVGTPLPGLRVLLVDDDELIRESVTPLLEMLGHSVTAAPGGPQALGLLQEGLDLDLVILDMNMPGMSGAEALPRILDLRPGLPVLMATGYSDQEIAPLLRERPSVSSIRKPFSLKEIQVKIAGLQIQPLSGAES